MKKSSPAVSLSNATYSDLQSFEAMAPVNSTALLVIDHYLGYDEVDWSREMMDLIR